MLLSRLLLPLSFLVAASGLQAAALPLTQWTSSAGGNDHYYQVFYRDSFIRWSDALLHAEALGGYLATITSVQENDFVTALTNSPNGPLESWIGFTDEAVEGDFRWITGEAVSFTNWANGEPNNDPRFNGEDYAIINPPPEPAGTWNDLPNDPRRVTAWVVEWDQEPVATPEPSTFLTLAAGAALALLRRRRSS